ncbi:hypothetical protein HDU79_001259 [Rhizoclosmatium sp. JEL0117]|nr:hypothetical protein HDU79_001259 [Rhizoclosmatium sp. JEL0117]
MSASEAQKQTTIELTPAPTNDQSPKRTIAIAIDNSKYSTHAVQWASTHYLNKDDLVILINVRPTYVIPPANDVNYNEYSTKIENAYVKASRELLESQLDILTAKGFNVKAHGLYGHTKEVIANYVNENKVDTLIIGSRGLNAVSRALLGSVSDYCAHHCHCSVLIVKPTTEQLNSMGIGGAYPLGGVSDGPLAALAAAGPLA